MVCAVAGKREATKWLKATGCDLLLLNLDLEEESGFDVLDMAVQYCDFTRSFIATILWTRWTELEMAPEEKSARMHRMRETLRENNIYRWAGNLIEELTRIRIAPATVKES